MGYAHNNVLQFPNREKPNKPFQAKGHDKTLLTLQNSRGQVEIEMINGATRTGMLVRRDRYTITIRDGKEGARERTIYKHAIASFTPLAPIEDLPALDEVPESYGGAD